MNNFNINTGNRVMGMQVEQMIMVESGTYNPMYNRPYQSHLDAGGLNLVINRVEQIGHGRITGQLLSGIASNILSPTAVVDPTREIAIPHGWNERRIRFVLKINCRFNLGSDITYYFQGYTNYPGVTMQGAIDPQMVFIINSVIAIGKAAVNYGPMGYSTMDRVLSTFQVVADPTWQSMTQQVHSRLMRPQDVFSGMEDNYLRHGLDHYAGHGSQSVYDVRTTLRTDPQRSNRSNNMVSNYLSKVIDGYYTSAQLSDFGHGNADILTKCQEMVMEEPISENPFNRWLGERRNQSATAWHQFTFSDLEALDPTTAQRVHFMVAGQAQQANQHQAGLTSYWTGADRTTVVASSLTQAVPSLMMENLISKIVLRSTNHDIGGVMNTVLIDVKSITGMDLTRYYDLFIQRLEQEVIRDFTFGNQELYQLEIRSDIFGETWINLSLAGQPPVQYVAPSFCDNLYAPIVTQNAAQYDALVMDMERLTSHVNDALGHSQPAIPAGAPVAYV
ncbi:MAG: hypothetical protein ACR2HF_08985 [Methylococcaceae bacterium]